MSFLDLVKANRSCRNYSGDFSVSMQTLSELAECARFAPSAGNKQPLKMYLSCDKATNALIQPLTAWAALIRSTTHLPYPGNEPTAFIVICVDTAICPEVRAADKDIGIAAQTILLAAAEKGLAGCMIGSFDKKIGDVLNINKTLVPALVIALGKSNEKTVLEDAEGSVAYYRDAEDVHHVPKRTMEEIIINNEPITDK